MLFGHQNDNVTQPADALATAQDSTVNPLPADTSTTSLPVAQAQSFDPSELADTPSVLNQPAADDSTTTAPVVTSLPPAMDPVPSDPVSVDPSATPALPAFEETTAVANDQPDAAAPAGSDDLLSLKQQALTQLSPLVSQLDQTPEEKFRTTMMMIQSTDNQALIKHAYDAAQQIPDEKIRAQALLDVVNEINYFTQAKS